MWRDIVSTSGHVQDTTGISPAQQRYIVNTLGDIQFYGGTSSIRGKLYSTDIYHISDDIPPLRCLSPIAVIPQGNSYDIPEVLIMSLIQLMISLLSVMKRHFIMHFLLDAGTWAVSNQGMQDHFGAKSANWLTN